MVQKRGPVCLPRGKRFSLSRGEGRGEGEGGVYVFSNFGSRVATNRAPFPLTWPAAILSPRRGNALPQVSVLHRSS